MTSWPGYPPPAPPKPSKPWYRNVWLWITVYAVVAVVGCVALVVLMFHDVTEDFGDYPGVDQGSVNRAVMEPCDEMTSAGQDIKVFSSPAEGADALHTFVTTARRIPAAIDAVDDADSAALQWRDDWTTLLDALDAYADDLAAGPKAEFTPPQKDGTSLMVQMSWVVEVPCELPPAIVALDPEAAAGFAY